MDLRRSHLETAGWAVLGLLLLATLVGALRLDRSKLPLTGDEATYAMQAASLAWDFDLTYTRQDYDRFVAHWGVPPEGLILQSREGSDRLVYGKPPLYALVIAPFVRAAPVRGPVVANALLLAAAALLAARALRGRLGPAAPLWVAAFVFASIAFAYVFWGDSDLFLFAAVAIAFALVYGEDRKETAPSQIYEGEDTEPAGRSLARWLGAGMLLGVAVAYRPVYLGLLLPALLAARESPPDRRGRALTSLVSGAVLLLLASMGIQWLAGGDATGYGGQRQGIYAHEAFPAVEYPAAQWSERVAREGNASWLQKAAVKPQLNPKLAGWNVLYTLAGRNVGVLPYFLPLLLGFVAFRGDRGRWAIPLAVGAALLAFLVLRPFNFYGGGALGNRYFLPLYPALWFMAARPARAVWPAVAALLAAPFLAQLWAHPTAYPLGEGGEYRHVSRIAQRWLPYEMTQSAAPGQEVAVGSGLWVKILNRSVWPSGKGGSLRIAGDARAELIVGSPQPLGDLHLEFDQRAPSRLVIDGRGVGELRPLLLKPDGHILFEVPLGRERAVHPLWWGPYDYHLYVLDFHLPGAPATPIGFHVLPPRDLIQRR
ncbi:MAG TPA: glycosyltransferase 87 family protein [Thermoanaerobaculia bacterium]|nr:glycosyltransferase 87 family protein [Thermoanaerobaculia bacterium]